MVSGGGDQRLIVYDVNDDFKIIKEMEDHSNTVDFKILYSRYNQLLLVMI